VCQAGCNGFSLGWPGFSPSPSPLGARRGFCTPPVKRANKGLMNIETKQKLIKDFYDVVHILAGIMVVLAWPWYPVLSVIGITIFGIFEYWQAKETGDEGSHDFWGAVLGYFIGLGILLVLKLVGVI